MNEKCKHEITYRTKKLKGNFWKKAEVCTECGALIRWIEKPKYNPQKAGHFQKQKIRKGY